ncbi:MAG: saccharopine dehydrogenase NADP-binding domain-containing protein [Candidatus Aminicenantes bacterium]|nr:saccharopine dehydrogenase NADP-binding domain-containing protein [Candidatus Aminicenantes bacterium]
MKVIVLGGGLVGGPMAADLAAEPGFHVAVADVRGETLEVLRRRHGLRTVRRDLSSPRAVKSLVREFDLVLSAVPGAIGFRVLRAVLEAGKPAVDIAFFPEDPFRLAATAERAGVPAVIDAGVAPGLSHILVAHARTRLDETRSAAIYVGGLPEVRERPFEYKAVFSPADVIEEYLRPARLVENGRVVVRPALSEPELLDFPGVGTLEAFNTDGLRSLLRTTPIPNMKEKTLRYPGHRDLMAVLRDSGFLAAEPVRVEGVRVRPLALTTRLLFPKWTLAEGERDLTVLRVVVEGVRSGRARRLAFDLLDRYDAASGVHSMARTTGYTASLIARMIASGLYDRPGLSAPEQIGERSACVGFLLDGLSRRGVAVRESDEEVSPSGNGPRARPGC